jgi:endonuclease G
MAPAADMASVRAQDESFSLANMVPQLPELNRGLWSRIEATTRNLARQYGEVYVVTGPAFIGKSLNRLNGRLIVPSHTYKAVYLPGSQQAGVWWAENKGKGSDFEVISVKELSSRIGVDVFPGVPDEVKSIAVQLPAPKAYSNRNTVAKPVRASDHAARTATSPESKEPGWADYGIAIIQHLLK